MQYLEVISVNIWQILISLLNLLILFAIIKKFFFKPVNNMLSKREEELKNKYDEAERFRNSAAQNQELWENKLNLAKTQADDIRKKANDAANRDSDKVLAEAKRKADDIIRQAEEQAKFELKKAEDSIKTQIVEVSTALAGKILEKEIKASDHAELIDSFIEKIGDLDEQDR